MPESSFGDITINRKWPGSSGQQDKTPSILTYDFSDPDYPKVKSWGYTATPSATTYTWFKLGLAENEAASEHDDELLHRGMGKLQHPLDKEFSDLATDYLSHLYEHFLSTLREDSLRATFDGLAYRFVIAVPAGWPDRVRQLIKSCAQEAGFGTRAGDSIRMIDEPEAAALAAFHGFEGKFKQAKTFKVTLIDLEDIHANLATS